MDVINGAAVFDGSAMSTQGVEPIPGTWPLAPPPVPAGARRRPPQAMPVPVAQAPGMPLLEAPAGLGVPFGAEEPQAAPASRYGLPQGPGWTVLKLAIAGGMLWAGYKRGVKVERRNLNKRLILPFLGWSLLGPVGPGYLIGRLTTD